MSERVEFTESAEPHPAHDDVDEVIETGGGPRAPGWVTRVPRGAWTAATVLVLAAAAAFGVGRAGGSERRGPTAAPTSAPSSSTQRSSAAPTPEQSAIAFVQTLAREPDSLGDVVRSGVSTCRLVAIGSRPPQDRAERAIRRILPGYTVVDVGRILDANSGLCSLTVRARDGAGSVLVLTVNGPAGSRQPQTVFTRVDDPQADTATLATVHTTRDGWAVRIGTDGPSADEPRAFDLVQVAEDATLRW